MKKRIISTALALTLLAALLTSCAAPTETITELTDLNNKVIAAFAAPIPVELMKLEVERQTDITIAELLYFDTKNAAVAALESNQVDAVLTTDITANYYVQRNENLVAIPGKRGAHSGLHMALRKDDVELLALINETIISMKEDGTFAEFEKVYITELSIEDTLTGQDLPRIDGAQTVYVGISGDIPPLDYMATDGKPAGYSLAVLKEISERAGINFEVVSIANQAKFMALLAERIDIFFFHMLSHDIPAMAETAAAYPDIAFTESYFTKESGTFLVRKG